VFVEIGDGLKAYPDVVATNLKRQAVHMKQQTANAQFALAFLSVLMWTPSAVQALSADAAAPTTAMVSDPCLPPVPLPEVDDRAKSDWPNLCKYRGANAALTTPTKVVFIGDSITESWVTGDPKLFSDGVIGRGISGQTSPQILLRFFQDVIELRPQIVHIMAGTNDIAGNTGLTTEQAFENNIVAMVTLARAHHIQVALASILPAGSFSWKPGLRPAATIKELNNWLRSYAQKSHIRFVDYYAVLTDTQGGFKAELSDDGVHPNQDGYAAMRKLALRGIAK
jgi:lysophospholipase L1-like esterase